MKPRKILNTPEISSIEVQPIFTDAEVLDRHKDYIALSDKDFDTKYKDKAFEPAILHDGSATDNVQYNYCSDPFCPNYGKPLKIIKARGARSIKNYNFVNAKGETRIMCNIMEYTGDSSRVDNDSTPLVSNWSVAEEIKRLKIINSIVNEKIEYVFHEPSCKQTSTPLDKSNSFMSYGKTSAGSPRYKCKECGKVTTIKADTRTRLTYHQQRSDVNLDIFTDIISRVPVRKICERNNIGASTFYLKVEYIYQKCLEFLERHESKLSDIEFKDLYLASDSFVYMLNNIRRKGKGGKKQSESEKANANEASTYMTATGDIETAYIFRSDIAYDTSITLDDIIKDTELYHCDHTFHYLRKNDRIRHFYYEPQEPTLLDSESQSTYLEKKAFFDARDNFVEGLHTQQNYTVLAHFHLLRELLEAKNYVFVTDADMVLKNSIFKVYRDKFSNYEAFYFTSLYDKTLDRNDAFTESIKIRNEVVRWATAVGLKATGVFDKAVAKVENEMMYHDFFKNKTVGSSILRVGANNLYTHPLPAKDEGRRYINMISPKGYLSHHELAEMIVRANTRTVDNFFQEIRRHLNILERPLVGARGLGKTYIYSNYNPKYAQQLVTIYRTYYNFVKPRKYYNTKKAFQTPAMRIGIADKPYTLKDILYFI